MRALLKEQPQSELQLLSPSGLSAPAPCFLTILTTPQEAASANALSDIRLKLLNTVLLTAGLGHLLVLAPRLNGGGPLLPVVLGTWALAALLGGVNLLQKPRDA